jgi:hypothetical protein
MAFALAVAFLVVSTPTIAATGGGDAPSKPIKEKKICKVDEANSTSRMRKNVCRTPKEWQEAREGKTTRDDLERVSSKN